MEVHYQVASSMSSTLITEELGIVHLNRWAFNVITSASQVERRQYHLCLSVCQCSCHEQKISWDFTYTSTIVGVQSTTLWVKKHVLTTNRSNRASDRILDQLYTHHVIQKTKVNIVYKLSDRQSVISDEHACCGLVAADKPCIFILIFKSVGEQKK